MRYSANSNNSKCKQTSFKLFVTGYFDDSTVKAAKAFQKTHKPEVDGHVGPKTRKVLELKPAKKKFAINPHKLWLAIALGEMGIIENLSSTRRSRPM